MEEENNKSIGIEAGSTADTSEEVMNADKDDAAAAQVRRRLTSHRQSLLRMHDDTRATSKKHIVPDPRYTGGKPESVDLAPDAPSENGTSPEGWVIKQRQTLRVTLRQRSAKDWLTTLVPMARWIPTYDWKHFLLTDILAGLAVGVMIIPQSMSYAKLAGLPVEYGLYSSLVPIFAYALFGSSRQLAVGPVALVSLLLNTGLTLALEQEGITPDNNPDYQTIYTTLALQTSILVGISFLVMGLLRLGFVTIFLSHAVASGFTSGAAIIIGVSQLKYFFGYSIPNDNTLHKLLKSLFASIDEFNYKTFLLGTFCVLTLMGMKKLSQMYPMFKWTKAAGPLSVTVVTIILQATVDLEAHGIPIVGDIPSGLPSFTGDVVFPLSGMGHIAVAVVSIVLIGFFESIAIAKQLAGKHNYELDSSLELVGLGVANITSGLFGGYPVVGSFSRSAVNNEAGAMSGISGMVTATLVMLVLLFLTPVFELLPMAVLASIVISGVISLVDYPEAIYLWKVHKFDFVVWMLAFLGTLFLGAEMGLAIAVGISLLLVIFESAYPHTSVLGRLPGTHQYRSIKQYPSAERYDGIVMVRIEAPMYFANTQNFRDKVGKYYDQAQKQQKWDQDGTEQARNDEAKVKFIILDLSAVSHVDTSALHVLTDMNTMYRNKLQVQMCLANPNRAVMRNLVLSGLADDIGRERIFVSLHDAVKYCLQELDNWERNVLQNPTELDSLMHDVEPASSPRKMNNSLRGFSDDPVTDEEAGL